MLSTILKGIQLTDAREKFVFPDWLLEETSVNESVPPKTTSLVASRPKLLLVVCMEDTSCLQMLATSSEPRDSKCTMFTFKMKVVPQRSNHHTSKHVTLCYTFHKLYIVWSGC